MILNLNVFFIIYVTFFIITIILLTVFISLLVLSRKKSIKKQTILMDYDFLTKIYNRKYYYKKCEEFLNISNESYAITSFDINKFKLINEYYGTDEADKLLIEIATILDNMSKDKLILKYGRIESDKFSFLTFNDKELIERIFNKLNVVKNKTNHSISFNMGVYPIEDNKMDIEQAYSRANLAHKSIKGSFDKYICYFDNEMINRLKQEEFIINNIDDAIKNEDILVYFQPKYDLQSGVICGAEALVRWHHKEKGMISPGLFVPALENNGLIVKLDKFIWRRTARYIREWLDKGIELLPVSVNLSKIDLLESDIIDYIESLIIEYSIPHRLFQLEITESACVDTQIDVVSILKKFKSKGFTILMDDFGSGYSSLNTLRQFPIDVLKIDLKFLSGFDDSNETIKGKTIIESIVSMAKHLNLEVVVEGTETHNQVEYCRSIGCEVAQGYFYSKPIPADEYIFLTKKKDKHKVYESKLSEDTILNKTLLDEDLFNKTTTALGVLIYRKNLLEPLKLNDRYFEILETNRKDFYTRCKNILDDIYPLDYDLVLDTLKCCIKNKKDCIIEYRRINYNGNIKWVRSKISYVNSNDSSINYFFISMDDITKEKESEIEKLEIINNLDYGIIKCNLKNNNILFYNDMFKNIIDVTDEDISKYKSNYLNIIDSSNKDLFLDNLDDLNHNEKTSLNIKININNKIKDVKINIIMYNKDNKKYAYFTICKI